MVQAPPSLLWQSRRPAESTVSSGSPMGESSSNQPQRSPPATRREHTNDMQAIAAIKAKQRNKARCRPSHIPAPSFTSSPLTQRPLSPSAMSDSGSESSASTARPIDIIRGPGRSRQHPPSSPSSSQSSFRRSITALTFGETIASSPSSEDEEGDEVYDAFHPMSNRASPIASSSKHTLDAPLMSNRRRSSGPSSPRQSLAVSPTTSLNAAMHRAARRRSSGNYGNPSLSSSVSSTPPASPSLFSSSFVGSYEASLLSGRMANRPSNSAALPFFASLGVLGLGKNTPRGLKCPDHLILPFGAYFWDMDNQEKQGKGSPYVGTIDLEEHYMQEMEQSINDRGDNASTTASPRFPGYRIPPKGQIQLVVKNANQTAVKLFLVPYDLSDMPPGSKTFLRQKSYDVSPDLSPSPSPGLGATSPSPRTKETLRYAIHLQFCAPPVKERERGRRKTASTARRGGMHHHSVSGSPQARIASASPRKRSPSPTSRSPRAPKSRARSDTATASHIYLHKNIRIVFTSRALDLSEKLKVVLEGPAGSQTQSNSKPSPLEPPSLPEDFDSINSNVSRYTAYSGPGEEWEAMKKMKVAAEKAAERRMAGTERLLNDPNGSSLSSTSLRHTSNGNLGRSGMPLLNTPPSSMSYKSASFAQPALETYHPARLEEAASVPEPLTFQRSPPSATVALPSLMESGLSISRPGSRSEMRKNQGERRTSPEKRSFGPVLAEGCLR